RFVDGRRVREKLVPAPWRSSLHAFRLRIQEQHKIPYGRDLTEERIAFDALQRPLTSLGDAEDPVLDILLVQPQVGVQAVARPHRKASEQRLVDSANEPRVDRPS